MIDDHAPYFSSDAFPSPFLTQPEDIAFVRRLAGKQGLDEEHWALALESLVKLADTLPGDQPLPERKTRVYGEFLRQFADATPFAARRAVLVFSKFNGARSTLAPDAERTFRLASAGSLTRIWHEQMRGLPKSDAYRSTLKAALLGPGGCLERLPTAMQRAFERFVQCKSSPAKEWRELCDKPKHAQHRLALMAWCQPVPFFVLARPSTLNSQKHLLVEHAETMKVLFAHNPAEFKRMTSFVLDRLDDEILPSALLYRTLMDEGSSDSLAAALEIEQSCKAGIVRDNLHATAWLLRMAMLASVQDWPGFGQAMVDWKPEDLSNRTAGVAHVHLGQVTLAAIAQASRAIESEQWKPVMKWIDSAFVGSLNG